MEQLFIFNYHANVAKTDHALYAQKFRSGRNANLIMVISVEKELLNNFLNWIFLRPKKYNAANRSFILDFIGKKINQCSSIWPDTAVHENLNINFL